MMPCPVLKCILKKSGLRPQRTIFGKAGLPFRRGSKKKKLVESQKKVSYWSRQSFQIRHALHSETTRLINKYVVDLQSQRDRKLTEHWIYVFKCLVSPLLLLHQ